MEVMMESKKEIYDLIPQYYPKTELIQEGTALKKF
jgi:hypothetical protein